LLESFDNGLGSRTTIAHAPSTKHYLRDRAAGLPWITKLPFPVQVVDSVTIEDLVSSTTFGTSYRYHHGFYDGEEREFRGFGMVEQRDTQTVAPYAGAGELTEPLDAALFIPPAVVKTWYHTGAFLDGVRVTRQYAAEYWAGDPQNPQLPDTALPLGLLPDEARQAFRALRGHVLRQESYAEDQTLLALLPYLVTESNYSLEELHPKGDGRYAVFAVHPRETLQLHYERNPNDPRTQHELTLKMSPYGDVVDHVSIAYARRGATVTPAQGRAWATWQHRDYHDFDAGYANDYRVGLPQQETTAELGAVTATGLVSLTDAAAAIATPPVAYDPLRRPLRDPIPTAPITVQSVRHYYWDDNLTTALPLTSATPRALAYESLGLALDDACLALFSGRVSFGETSQATLVDPTQGGYRFVDGAYWSSTGVLGYQKAFYLFNSLTNPFSGVSSIAYDPSYSLLPISATDPVGLTTQIDNDWRLLTPRAITDANHTRTEASTDILGIVIGTAVHGAAGEGGPTAAIDYTFYASPTAPTRIHSKTFTAYDVLGAFEEHVVYSDGLGREIATKTHVKDGPLLDGGMVVSPRWVGTGRTVFNNKAKPVKKYEPYFAANADFDTEAALVKQGVTPVLHYDPLGRLVRIEQPNGTFSQVVFDAWSQTSSDENDTVDDSQWYFDRTKLGTTASPGEQAAAAAAHLHAKTPKVEHFDPLGRVVLTVLDNKTETHATLVELDIEGKPLTVIDPENKDVLDQWFDVAGRVLKAHSMDAGDTWTIPDAAGQPYFVFRAQGNDGIRLQTLRDLARRPTQTWVLKDGDPLSAAALREQIVYGSAGTGPALAHGRVLVELDGAGLEQFAYDFRGNVAMTARRVLVDYHAEPEWSVLKTWDGVAGLPTIIDATLEPALTTTSTYDGKNRPLTQTTPDGSVTTFVYDIAGMLATLATALGRRAPGPNQTENFVTNIDYDAKGRRKSIQYGNGVQTIYDYDPLTFRLTAAHSNGAGITQQDLSYVYDPVGNITSIADAAQPTVCYGGQLVAAESDYTYDAVYRLTHATGREHPAQAGLDQRDIPTPLPLPTDCSAFVNYSEDYVYDKAGNIKSLAHTSNLPTGSQTVTRGYTYDGVSNRLQATAIGTDNSAYVHTDRGCMKQMPHLDAMLWNHHDQLIAATRTRRGNGPSVAPFPAISNPVFFAYDIRGQRVRKVAESSGVIADRIYVGSYELYRERSSLSSPPSQSRETLHAFDGHTRVAMVESRTDGSDELIRYQLSNHLGSATVELDHNASLISYEEFHPYGTTALYSGPSSKRYRYAAMERDDETGLESHGVRYYAPWLGRWGSCDPAGMTEGANLYLFNRANPTRFRDSDGRRPTDFGEPRNVDPFEGGYPQDPPPRAPSEREQTLGLDDANQEHVRKLLSAGWRPSDIERAAQKVRDRVNPAPDPIGAVGGHVDLRVAAFAITIVLRAVQAGIEGMALGGVFGALGRAGRVIGAGLALHSAQRNARTVITGEEDGQKVGVWGRVVAAAGLLVDFLAAGRDVKALGAEGGGGRSLLRAIPGLTRQQTTAVARLRAGEDVVVRDVAEARKLLANMPELRPFNTGEFIPTKPAPRGTYRGDLINTADPTAPFVHPPGSAPPQHALGPHYNLHFPSGKKSAIIIRPD
jgi:RHS repeat-associated protein